MAAGPLFYRLAQELKENIRAGTFEVGTYLPSVRQLQENHGLSKNTVLAALRVLQEENLIARAGAARHGFRVTARPDSDSAGRASSIGGIVKLAMPISHWNFVGSKLLESVESSFGDISTSLLLGNHQNDTTRERAILQRLVDHHTEAVDTLILMTASSYSTTNRDLIRALADQMPVFLLDRRVKGVNAHLVTINNHAVGRRAAEVLLRGGARTFGFISGFWNLSGNRDRFGGFRDGLEDATRLEDLVSVIKMDTVYEGVDTLEESWDRLEAELQRLPELPDAIFCGSDKTAGAVLRHCEGRGVRVPDDLLIIGVDNDQIVKSLTQRHITSFAFPFEAISSELVRLFMEFRNAETRIFRTVELDAEFVIGDTT